MTKNIWIIFGKPKKIFKKYLFTLFMIFLVLIMITQYGNSKNQNKNYFIFPLTGLSKLISGYAKRLTLKKNKMCKLVLFKIMRLNLLLDQNLMVILILITNYFYYYFRDFF